MTMTKPKHPPTNREFNAAILDRVLAQVMPTDQREDEFTTADLMARGMKSSSAQRFCDSGFREGKFARRIGVTRLTGRRAWLYKVKE